MTISELPNAKNSLQRSPICVLDASSYLGFWILKGILSRGHSIHAAVQNNGGETEIMKNIKLDIIPSLLN
ncbi:cinnamoyl-CoA reductase 1 [Cinnamomum micranthum f. kanehirae]|uniref:Cinnamoyl-CoA reductase 1 n=1 Tax=Cinnamomum micranthum f. kanehirae TaxID=337451 RepID=A0A3S3N6F8_9MAGN|nr:cinnamoyl-CoA reductase 1 [Cinnamomum micranthum f. kanehirae]